MDGFLEFVTLSHTVRAWFKLGLECKESKAINRDLTSAFK